MPITSNVPDLTFGVFRFEIRCTTQMYLRPFVASVLRGAFGGQFRRLVCLTRMESCEGCMLRSQCPYGVLFEPAPPTNSERLGHYSAIPRGYVLNPEKLYMEHLSAGAVLSFEVTLIGTALKYLPYFIYVFRKLENNGIGANRHEGGGRFLLERVMAKKPDLTETLIFDRKEDVLQHAPTGFHAAEWIEPIPDVPDMLTLEFTSATYLKHARQPVKSPEFHHIIRSLYRRISNLMFFYESKTWNLDFAQTFAEAEKIALIKRDTQWKSMRRYTARLQTELDNEGFVGKITFYGDLAPFWPSLLVGQFLHIGHAAVFGLGRYACSVPNLKPISA